MDGGAHHYHQAADRNIREMNIKIVPITESRRGETLLRAAQPQLEGVSTSSVLSSVNQTHCSPRT